MPEYLVDIERYSELRTSSWQTECPLGLYCQIGLIRIRVGVLVYFSSNLEI